MRLLTINTLEQAKEAIRQVGADEAGVALMAPKAVFRVVHLAGVSFKAANILKQEMLSIGGEAAVHRGVINHTVETTDVILMGTVAHYRRLVKKLMAQPFGLRRMAEELHQLVLSSLKETE
jgi:dihydropteroate synthase